MSQRRIVIYYNQTFQAVTERELQNFTPGILKGQGVFETLLYENRKIYFLKEHVRRFSYGLKFYRLSNPFSFARCLSIGKILLEQNPLQGGRVRFCAWKDQRGQHSLFMILPRQGFSNEIYQQGFQAVFYPKALAPQPGRNQVKDLDYHFYLKAYEWALRQGGQEALLINTKGDLVEGSRSNVFWVKGGILYTPATSTGCLSGVTRQMIIRLAKTLGIQVKQTRGLPLAMVEADEAFLTNALIGMMPLVGIACQKIGTGVPGPMTRQFMKSYKKLNEASAIFMV